MKNFIPTSLNSVVGTVLMITALSVNATAAEEKKGTAEKMGEQVGPYIAGAAAGAATALLPIQSKAVSVIVSGATGSAGVHVVGDVGKKVGGGYGKIVDQTGNNPLMPSPIKGHKPSGTGGCAGKSMANCIVDTVKKVMKGQDVKQ